MHEDAKHFVANGLLVNQEWVKLVVSLSCWRKEGTDHRFDFSRNDDDFEVLAKGFQPKNTKLSNSWALKIYSEWATAHWEHKAQSNHLKWPCWYQKYALWRIAVYTRKKEQQTGQNFWNYTSQGSDRWNLSILLDVSTQTRSLASVASEGLLCQFARARKASTVWQWMALRVVVGVAHMMHNGSFNL